MKKIYIQKNKHIERQIHRKNIYMKGHIQKDIYTKRHTWQYIHIMGLTHKKEIYMERYINRGNRYMKNQINKEIYKRNIEGIYA